MTSADERPVLAASPSGRPPVPAAPLACGGGALLLAVNVQQDGATTELRLSGELDMATADDLRRHIWAVIDAHAPHRLVLELSGLDFVDSSGLAVMVWAHQVMARHGRELRLRHPQPRVLRVLNIAGLHNRLHITEADAGVRRPPRSPRPRG